MVAASDVSCVAAVVGEADREILMVEYRVWWQQSHDA
jgi:hypothetical protein